jgi:hypothetical protein
MLNPVLAGGFLCMQTYTYKGKLIGRFYDEAGTATAALDSVHARYDGFVDAYIYWWITSLHEQNTWQDLRIWIPARHGLSHNTTQTPILRPCKLRPYSSIESLVSCLEETCLCVTRMTFGPVVAPAGPSKAKC